jgi:hypothetical protein
MDSAEVEALSLTGDFSRFELNKACSEGVIPVMWSFLDFATC